MAFDFPASPTLNQVYTPAGGPSYVWNGTAWVTISVGIPDAPADGALYGRAGGAWAKGVKLSGDTMTGALTLSGAPTVDLHAATKKYADDGLALKVNKAGDTLSGELRVAPASGDAWLSAKAGGTASHIAFGQKTSGDAVIWINATGKAWTFGSNGNLTTPGGIYANGVISTPNNITAGGAVYSTESVVIKAASANANLLLQTSSGSGVHAIFSIPSMGSINFYNTITNAYHRQYSDGGFETSLNWTAKPGGGSWQDTSDARIKQNVADYKVGLDEVVALRPVTYEFIGNDFTVDPAVLMIAATDDAPAVMPTSSHAQVLGKTFTGLIAQEVEDVFPGMVTLREGWIDGEHVTDMRGLDTTPLIFALVNAVKELKARVEELEAKL